MTKSIKIEGTFEVINPSDQSVEGKYILRDTSDYDCVITHHPSKIAGGTTHAPIAFGSVTLAKRIFLRVTQEVLVKYNVTAPNDGFNLGIGDHILMNDSGVTALFLTTGPTETEVTAVIAGDC
jgi:hypothetical protein